MGRPYPDMVLFLPANDAEPQGDGDQVDQILAFWFPSGPLDEVSLKTANQRWFDANQQLDTLIKTQFGQLLEHALADRLDHWAERPRGRLALILLLDQFCRNVNRGSALAFAGDYKARSLCVEGLDRNADQNLEHLQRVFFYMPLQHSEDLADQQRAVALYAALADEGHQSQLEDTLNNCTDFARLHRDIVLRFGRFPHRNRLLGRSNTTAEQEYLESSDAHSFGQ